MSRQTKNQEPKEQRTKNKEQYHHFPLAYGSGRGGAERSEAGVRACTTISPSLAATEVEADRGSGQGDVRRTEGEGPFDDQRRRF